MNSHSHKDDGLMPSGREVTSAAPLLDALGASSILYEIQNKIIDLSHLNVELSKCLQQDESTVVSSLELVKDALPPRKLKFGSDFQPQDSPVINQTPPMTPRSPRTNGAEALSPIPKHSAIDDIDVASDDGHDGKFLSERSRHSAWSLSSPNAMDDLVRDSDGPRTWSSTQHRIRSLCSDPFSKKIFRLKDSWSGFLDLSSTADADNLDLAQRSAKRTIVTDDEDALRASATNSSSARFTQADTTLISMPPQMGCSRHFVASPASPSRVLWECASIGLILYDVIAIPLALSFQPPDSTFRDCVDWVQRVFWTFNIFVVLSTGFISKGMLIMQPGSIFLHYIKTWFVVDAITVFPDWVFVIMSVFVDNVDDDKSDASGLVKTLRVMRVFRVARLLRMGKLRDAWVMLYDMIDSEKFGLLLDVFKNILMLMVIIHYMAAAWFAVGEAQAGISWIKYHNFERDDVGWEHQYVVSYHWCLTQIASTMHVQPQSVSERIFAIFVVLLGLIGFAYFVGSITGSLARLRAIEETRTSNFWFLRKFLKRHHVPHELAVRIRTYCESRYERQQMLADITEVESLNLLSEKLKAELACAIHGPTLCVHPLFSQLLLDSVTTVQRLALHLSHLSLAPKDIMFTAGEEATTMSVPSSGKLQYDRIDGNNSFPEEVTPREDWIAEPTLWVSEWIHLGILKSVTAAEFILIKPDTLFQVSSINPVAFFSVSAYAVDYAAWLNTFERCFLTDITQGSCEGETIAEFVRTRTNSARPFGSQKKMLGLSHQGSTIGGILARVSAYSKGSRKSTVSSCSKPQSPSSASSIQFSSMS